MIATIKNYIPRESVEIEAVHDLTSNPVHALRASASGMCYVHYVDDPAGVYRATYIVVGGVAYGEIDAVQRGTFSAGELIGLRYPEV